MAKKTTVSARRSNSKRWMVIALASIAVLAVLWSFFGSTPKLAVRSDKSSSDL